MMGQQINLLNPLLRRQRDHFSFLNMLQALGVIVAGAMLFYGYAFYQSSQLAKEFELNTQRYIAEQVRLTTFTQDYSPQQAKDALQAEVSALEKELAEQNELIEALKSSSAGSVTGFSEYMRAFSRQVVQGLWLTSFKVVGDGAEISLSGGVLTPDLLPIYLQRLGKEKIMQGKNLAALQIDGASVAQSAVSSQRYVKFELHSTPPNEAKK